MKRTKIAVRSSQCQHTFEAGPSTYYCILPRGHDSLHAVDISAVQDLANALHDLAKTKRALSRLRRASGVER